MTTDSSWVANPGSRAAIAAGCICAALDNNHGQFPVIPPDGWWISGDCPVHNPGGEAGITTS